jgi:hypothetical protein
LEESRFIWTDYMRFRLELRGYDAGWIEEIVRYSAERYRDNLSNRLIAVGRHKKTLVMIPYERIGKDLKPITIHATTRRQINARLASGRFTHE